MVKWIWRKASKPEINISPNCIPTVQFDASLVTDDVKAQIKRNVDLISGLTDMQRELIYNVSLRSVSAGGDLHKLHAALMGLGNEGMTKGKASEIARHINNKATSLINRTKQQSLGIKYARWMYSGAPCMTNPKNPTAADVEQDAAHKAANDKRFKINEGMFLNGKWTWPGDEDGCRCSSRSQIKGFS